MEISPILLLRMTMSSFFFGGAIGFLYDLNRCFQFLCGMPCTTKFAKRIYSVRLPFLKKSMDELKKGTPAGKAVGWHLLIFFQDVFLFCVAAVGTVLLNYYFNDGLFRIYTVVALTLGFLLYYFTVSKFGVMIMEPTVALIRLFLTVSCFLLTRPMAYFAGFFGKNIKKLKSIIEITIAHQWKKVYNIYKVNKVSNSLNSAGNGEGGTAFSTTDQLDKTIGEKET